MPEGDAENDALQKQYCYFTPECRHCVDLISLKTSSTVSTAVSYPNSKANLMDEAYRVKPELL